MERRLALDIFRERLKTVRKNRGVTQTELARYLGISQASYVRYEKGTSSPTMQNMAKICEYLNVSADYLVGREGYILSRIGKIFEDG